MALMNSNSSMINWWLQGLGILVPTRLKNLFNPVKKRILLQLQGEQLAVIWPDQKKHNSQPEIYAIQHPENQKKLLKRLSKFNQDKHSISLCIPAKKGLRNNLKLPLSAEPDLANILEFEIDRQTPFTRDQVYSGYKLIDKNTTSNTLNVELNVIPKKNVDFQLNELQKIGITPQVVELLNDSSEEGINLLPGNAEKNNHQATGRLNSLLAILAIFLAVGAIALPFFQINTSIKHSKLEIAASKKGALEVNNLRSAWEKNLEKQTFINTKVSSRKSVTVILDELTRLIPDNSWLSRLQIRGRSIKLQGESSAATSLIGIIDQSEHFTDTRFQSPVTSNISTGNDRFQITAQISEQNSNQQEQASR